MEVINQDNLNIDEIVQALENGKTIVYPTETCYGLGCDATNQQAVDKIFQIKERQQDKPLLVVASSLSMMMNYVDWNKKLEELSQKYWPGPLTVVIKVKQDCGLAKGVTALDGTVGFRITSHPLAAELSAKLGRPLVSTSANIASLESSYEVESILKMFTADKIQPDIIIDGGLLPHKGPSTVVRVKGERVEVLRQGELVVE